MGASTIHCKSMLQASIGRWGCGMVEGATDGCPSVISTSRSSCSNFQSAMMTQTTEQVEVYILFLFYTKVTEMFDT